MNAYNIRTWQFHAPNKNDITRINNVPYVKTFLIEYILPQHVCENNTHARHTRLTTQCSVGGIKDKTVILLCNRLVLMTLSL